MDGLPWRPDATTRRFRLVKQRADVPAGIDLHGLRHTMITSLAAGVDPRTVMGRAGHCSEAMTMTVYAKVRPVMDAAAAELWGQILNDKLRALRNDRALSLESLGQDGFDGSGGHDDAPAEADGG